LAHDCVTCHLAESATWEDFEQKIRDEYSKFRKSGGHAFIGFWVPHTAEDHDGHLYVNCAGSYLVILGYSKGQTSLFFYDENREIETITIPWQEFDPARSTIDLLKYTEQPWLDPREANSVAIAARKAVDMLRNLDEDPVNAWFAKADWVMKYEA
jgi:hypothetical protein